MFKKMFALASVTALTGLVASVAASGCSSTTVSAADEGGTPATPASDAAADAKRPPIEAGPEPDADTTGGTCPTTDPIDATTAPWKPPFSDPGKCLEKDILDLVAFVEANPKSAYKDIKAAVTSVTCKACLFQKESTTWSALVEKADGSFLRNNFGGCVAVMSGKESCGKAFSQLDDCLSEACKDCADDAATQKCNTAAGKVACKAAGAAFATECGSADAVQACDDLATKYTFEAAARALCVGTANDGG